MIRVCQMQLDVTGLNYVSRRNEPFVLMTVEHAAFSADGRWLATVGSDSATLECTHICQMTCPTAICSGI